MDKSLAPQLAEVFKIFGHDFTTVDDLFGNRTEGVPDEEIIPRCAADNLIWITKDLAARKDHAFRLKTEGVSVLWIKFPKSGLSAFQQLKLLVRQFDQVNERFSKAHGGLHLEISVSGSIKTLWEQRPSGAPHAQ